LTPNAAFPGVVLFAARFLAAQFNEDPLQFGALAAQQIYRPLAMKVAVPQALGHCARAAGKHSDTMP
jgi:hypothetical protein